MTKMYLHKLLNAFLLLRVCFFIWRHTHSFLKMIICGQLAVTPVVSVRSVKQFLSLVRKLDVNMDTISNRVHSVLTHLEKRYDVTLALYQRFEK